MLRLLLPLLLLSACGTEAEFATQPQNIINGVASEPGDFPNVGAMLVTGRGPQGLVGGFGCTGTLISSDVVLTAAHCVEIPPELPISNLRFYFSLQVDVSDFGDQNMNLPPRTIAVRRSLKHPRWVGLNSEVPDGLGMLYDLALLFLEEPIEGVQVAQLTDVEGDLRSGAEVLIAGYGQRDPEVNPFVQPETGRRFHAETQLGEVGEAEIQIGTLFPTPQKCHGDSGGPTFMDFDDDRVPARRLIGVTSRGFQDDDNCREGGIDTRVDYHLEWIIDSMVQACVNGERVHCQGYGRLLESSSPIWA